MSIQLSYLTKKLRSVLDDNGYEWIDNTGSSISVYYGDNLMERTVVLRDGRPILICLYGYFTSNGRKTAWSHGWPDSLEVNQKPTPINEIIQLLKEEE